MKLIKSAFNLIVFVLLPFSMFSQEISYISLTGTVKDKLNETVPAATVMLLRAKDSTLLNYTTTNSDGQFNFKSLRNQGYLLRFYYHFSG